MINALFVLTDGPYFNRPGIEAWDVIRDAKKCRNGFPAIAHPPCERWGRYWSGGPSVKNKRILGDDDGCFAFSLWYVRTFGGVIEHPEASHAFKFYGLPIPDFKGGWSNLDSYGGRSCCVAQSNYGHLARKMTWLYAVKTKYPKLRWGPNPGAMKLEMSPRSKERARTMRNSKNYTPIKRLSVFERCATPGPFLELLVKKLFIIVVNNVFFIFIHRIEK